MSLALTQAGEKRVILLNGDDDTCLTSSVKHLGNRGDSEAVLWMSRADMSESGPLATLYTQACPIKGFRPCFFSESLTRRATKKLQGPG